MREQGPGSSRFPAPFRFRQSAAWSGQRGQTPHGKGRPINAVVLLIAAAAAPVAAAPQDARVVPPPVVRTNDPQLPPPVFPVTPTDPAAPPADLPPDGADVVVTARDNRGDPLADVNAGTFRATQAVDDAVVAPVARAYGKAPKPLRKGLRNFVSNLREPVVAAAYLLQLKPGKAAETVGRFAINTTVGVVGLFDVAKKKPFHLPRRRNGFANTLGFYGIKPGPYFFLPLLGPTTLRDLTGNILDQVLVPLGPIRPLRGSAATIPIAVVTALDYRLQTDEVIEAARASNDPYATRRKLYLDSRQAEIDALHGRYPRVSPPPVVRTIDPFIGAAPSQP